MQQSYDVVVVGASFAGLTLAHHLPKEYSVLVIDSKPTLDHAVESTGLITQVTYDLLAGFCDVKKFVPNNITHIGIMAPDYKQYFFSSTTDPWIYSTDTPNLVKHLAETVPSNVTVSIKTNFVRSKEADGKLRIHFESEGKKNEAECKFLIGADGAFSTVARDRGLALNTRFLVGFEKVFYGDILLGPSPEASVYHFWFGEFSLGYGGWLSPTLMNGKKAFRLGIAKLQRDVRDWKLIHAFIATLQEQGIIRIESGTKEVVQFSSLIPLNPPMRGVSDDRTLLIGNAAGMCGAFAADGIKGAIVSGQVGAELLERRFKGEQKAFAAFHRRIEARSSLMTYYHKQLIYRMAWDIMQRDRTFTTLFHLIERQKEHFLEQFCDSKDRQKSLLRVLFHWRNGILLLRYSFFMVIDIPTAFFTSIRRHGWNNTMRDVWRWLLLPLQTLWRY